MDTSVYIAIITAGAAILAASLSQFISAYFSAQRDREQWIRTQESQKDEWLRSKLLEIYSNCIDYLSKIPEAVEHGNFVDPVSLSEYTESYHMEVFIEAHKWLYMLLIFHPARDTIENHKLFEEVTRFSNLSPSEQQKEAPLLRDKVLRLAEEDPRLIFYLHSPIPVT